MSAMMRAVRLSMPDPLADLKALADSVFAAATPAAVQGMSWNWARHKLTTMIADLAFDDYWPPDTVAEQLADWRAEIDWAHYEVRYVIGAAA